MSLLWKLFFAFIKIGALSFGGGYAAIPLIQDTIVNDFGLMTLEEFADLVTVAEMTPGPILINAATFVGMRFAGIPGVVLCSVGCVLPSLVICLLLGMIYYRFRTVKGVQKVLAALRPGVVALIGSAAVSIFLVAMFGGDGQIALENIRGVEVVIFAVALFLLRKYKANPVHIILGSGVVGTLIYVGMSML